MSVRETYLAEVAKHITTHSDRKQQFIDDLRTHFEEGSSAGEKDFIVIERLGKAEDVATEFMANIELSFAGFWERFFSFVIDFTLTTYTNLLLAGVILGIPYLLIGKSKLLLLPLVFVILSTGAIHLLYFPILESRFGQTLGKRLFGIRVLSEKRTAIVLKEGFLRRLSYYFDILLLDALFIPFTEKKQRAFDIVASTIVVRDPGQERNWAGILISLLFTFILFAVILGLIILS